MMEYIRPPHSAQGKRKKVDFGAEVEHAHVVPRESWPRHDGDATAPCRPM